MADHSGLILDNRAARFSIRRSSTNQLVAAVGCSIQLDQERDYAYAHRTRCNATSGGRAFAFDRSAGDVCGVMRTLLLLTRQKHALAGCDLNEENFRRPHLEQERAYRARAAAPAAGPQPVLASLKKLRHQRLALLYVRRVVTEVIGVAVADLEARGQLP